MLELQTEMYQQFAETESGEEYSYENHQDLDDEVNGLTVAITGALAAEAINGEHASLGNQDVRSDEDR